VFAPSLRSGQVRGASCGLAGPDSISTSVQILRDSRILPHLRPFDNCKPRESVMVTTSLPWPPSVA